MMRGGSWWVSGWGRLWTEVWKPALRDGASPEAVMRERYAMLRWGEALKRWGSVKGAAQMPNDPKLSDCGARRAGCGRRRRRDGPQQPA
jgi:hypothetical protein